MLIKIIEKVTFHFFYFPLFLHFYPILGFFRKWLLISYIQLFSYFILFLDNTIKYQNKNGVSSHCSILFSVILKSQYFNRLHTSILSLLIRFSILLFPFHEKLKKNLTQLNGKIFIWLIKK